MPRPSGKTQRIAEQVVPGLRRLKKKRNTPSNKSFMSEVEIKQTNIINDKVDFKK